MIKDLVPISNRQKEAIKKILEWENRIGIDGMIDKGRSASTISRWAREQGLTVGLETMQRYIDLYERSQELQCEIASLPEIVGPTSLPDLFADLEGLREASALSDDIVSLDLIIDKGVKIVVSSEMITARDVVQAIKIKREIVASKADSLLEKLTVMEDRIRKLLDIIVDEVPDVYKEKILLRFTEEFGGGK